jgi:hypothetical protein
MGNVLKIIGVVLLIAIATLGIAACMNYYGGDNDASETTEPSEETTSVSSERTESTSPEETTEVESNTAQEAERTTVAELPKTGGILEE